jgi:hypothetical protein
MLGKLWRLDISDCLLHRPERKMRQTFYKKIKNYN